MSNLQYAGEYKISELKLFTSSGNVVNLSQIYSSIIIYEDIFNSSMTGSILLVDTNNIIMNMPITGQDFISLKIETLATISEECLSVCFSNLLLFLYILPYE